MNWFDLLLSRGQGKISEAEFVQRRNELVQVASDSDLEAMACLVGAVEATITVVVDGAPKDVLCGIPICQVKGERATRPGEEDSPYYKELDAYRLLRTRLQRAA